MKYRWVYVAGFTSGLAFACIASLVFGDASISFSRVLQILCASDPGPNPPTDWIIIRQLRLPRVLLACIVGSGLGIAGVGYQGIFRNPLADPTVIGASSGAALGATLAIIAGWQTVFAGLASIPVAAMLGAILAVGVVYGISQAGRQSPMLSLLLSGVAVSSLLSSIVSLMMFLHHDKLVVILGWLMGSLSSRGWEVVLTMAPFVLLGGLLMWSQSRALDALTFGDEAATALGLRLSRMRFTVVIAASLITAACVAAGGIIGFIGLIAPHFGRAIVGARHGYLIPTSALIGALLLLLADDVARTLVAPTELPVGIVTALLGSPFFLYLLASNRGLGGEA